MTEVTAAGILLLGTEMNSNNNAFFLGISKVTKMIPLRDIVHVKKGKSFYYLKGFT